MIIKGGYSESYDVSCMWERQRDVMSEEAGEFRALIHRIVSLSSP